MHPEQGQELELHPEQAAPEKDMELHPEQGQELELHPEQGQELLRVEFQEPGAKTARLLMAGAPPGAGAPPPLPGRPRHRGSGEAFLSQIRPIV